VEEVVSAVIEAEEVSAVDEAEDGAVTSNVISDRQRRFRVSRVSP